MSGAALSIILPCRNEASNLGFVLRELQDHFHGVDCEILVVDNASRDQSVEIAESFKDVKVVRELIPGYGRTLRTGFAEAAGDWILMMDADGTYPAAEARRLFDFANTTKASFVVGCRLQGHIQKKAMPWLHRYVGTPLLTALIRLRFPKYWSLRDCNSGLRVVERGVLAQLRLQSSGMEIASEMLIQAGRGDVMVTSLPISFRASPLERRGHLRPVRDGLRHLLQILSVRFLLGVLSPPVRR